MPEWPHKITGHYEERPESQRERCAICGKATVTQCAHCGAKIKGYLRYPSVVGSDDSVVPMFCDNCGVPFPWSKTEEQEFLAKDYGTADASKLLIDNDLKKIIQGRLDEGPDCV